MHSSISFGIHFKRNLVDWNHKLDLGVTRLTAAMARKTFATMGDRYTVNSSLENYETARTNA
jgi:hypothetical protein